MGGLSILAGISDAAVIDISRLRFICEPANKKIMKTNAIFRNCNESIDIMVVVMVVVVTADGLVACVVARHTI